MPFWLHLVEIELDRLRRHQVHRHGIGGERIDDDQVEALIGLLGHGQPRVAEHDVGLGLAVREEGEIVRIAGDADHHRIDLEEAPGLALLGVAGERARPEPRHAVAALALADAARAPWRWSAPSGCSGSSRWPALVSSTGLPSSSRMRCAPCSVVPCISVWYCAVARRLHTVDAEVAALRLAALDARRQPHERAEHQQRRHAAGAADWRNSSRQNARQQRRRRTAWCPIRRAQIRTW